MRTSRLVAAAATLAGSLVTTAAGGLTPAGAVPAGPRVVFVADEDGDGAYGIYTARTYGGRPSVVVPESESTDVSRAVLSPDGLHIAALVATNTSTGGFSLQVMNIDGGHRRTVVVGNDTASGSVDIFGISWAPDSMTLVYDVVVGTRTPRGDTATIGLHRYDLRTGASAEVPGGRNLYQPAVGADGRIAAIEARTGTLVVLDPSQPAALGVNPVSTGIAGNIGEPAWSPDESTLAFVRITTTPDDDGDTSEIDTTTLRGGNWSAPAVVAPTSDGAGSPRWFAEDPTFAPDGTLWFDRLDESLGAPQDIWSATYDGSAWSLTQHKTPGQDGSITFGALDTTPPTALTLRPFGLAGTTTYVNWITPDLDVSHVAIDRTGSDGSHVHLSAVAPPYADRTTKLGVTYTYTLTPTDGSGYRGPASAPRRVTAEAVRLVVSNPTSTSSARRPFPVSWGVAGNRGASYDVQWAPAGGSAQSWPVPAHATHATFTAGTLGRTYAFRARVRDGYGNSSAFTPWRDAAVPLDQTTGRYAGSWQTVTAPADWLGSVASTTHTGATATFRITSHGLRIIGDRLPNGASFRLYVNGAYEGTWSTKAATTRHRQVLYGATFATPGTRTVRIVAVVWPGRALHLDGIAAPG